jgi:Xaa-Pro aminopeptidase
VLSALDSIAWAFNVRGAGRRRTRRSRWLMRWSTPTAPPTCSSPARRSAPDVRQHLGNGVRCTSASSSRRAGELKGKTVVVDPERAVAAIFEALDKAGAKIVRCATRRSCPRRSRTRPRSPARKPRRRATARPFPLPPLDRRGGAQGRGRRAQGVRPSRSACAAKSGELRDLSFDTISGAGPNGAIVHYRSSEKTNRKLERARSIWSIRAANMSTAPPTSPAPSPIGEPTDEMRDRFTRVLKGHIAIATAVFPKGTRGSQLDSFARRPLWEAGLDYAHGTGHGVGSFLAVHEGPQRISPVGSSQSGGDEPLQAGMILSNEPGYYKTGEYGIRIENLVLVVRARSRARRRRCSASRP